jgi:hypothetical protein
MNVYAGDERVVTCRNDVTLTYLGDPLSESHPLDIIFENDMRYDDNWRFDSGLVHRPSTMDLTSQVFRPIPLKLSTVVSAHQTSSRALGGDDVIGNPAVTASQGSARFNGFLTQWNRPQTRVDDEMELDASCEHVGCDKRQMSLDLRHLLPSSDTSTSADGSGDVKPSSSAHLATSSHQGRINTSRGGGVVRPVPLRIAPYLK